MSVQEGWEAFWADAKMKPNADEDEVLLAFKGGVVMVMGIYVNRGLEVAMVLRHDPARLIKSIHPKMEKFMAEHPEWTEVHRHAMVAGAMCIALPGTSPAQLEDFLRE